MGRVVVALAADQDARQRRFVDDICAEAKETLAATPDKTVGLRSAGGFQARGH